MKTLNLHHKHAEVQKCRELNDGGDGGKQLRNCGASVCAVDGDSGVLCLEEAILLEQPTVLHFTLNGCPSVMSIGFDVLGPIWGCVFSIGF